MESHHVFLKHHGFLFFPGVGFDEEHMMCPVMLEIGYKFAATHTQAA